MSTTTLASTAPQAPERHKIYAVSTELPGTRTKSGIAVMIYAYLIADGEKHWGIGAEKNTQAMLAHALVRAANELFIGEERPAIHVICSDSGLTTYLDAHVPGWLRDGTRDTKDASGTWVELTSLSHLSNFDISKPTDADEASRFANLQEYARHAIRPLAEELWRKEQARFQTEGVTLTDDAPGAPKVARTDR